MVFFSINSDKCLSVFDPQYPRNCVRVWREHWLKNDADSCLLAEVIALHIILWLRQELLVPAHRLPFRILHADDREGWKKRSDNQVMI